MIKRLQPHHLFFSIAFGCVIRSIWSNDDLIVRWAATGGVFIIVGTFLYLNEN